jgi:hypothetical protein
MVVELLAAYSRSTQGAGLRLCHTAVLTNPAWAPETDRDTSVEPARPTQ